MKYLQSHGVAAEGGSNFGSGLGFIPSSSLQGLGGMGSQISGSGQLGSFGAMNQRFGTVGMNGAQSLRNGMYTIGAADAAPAPVVPAPEAPIEKVIEKVVADAVDKKKAEESGNSKYLMYGGLALGAYFLWNSTRKKGL